jgi:hypothetical protein
MADSAEEPASIRRRQEPPLREFSWSYWLFLTTVICSFAFYFIRRGPQATANAASKISLLDARFGFTPFEALRTLRAIGPEGRRIYGEINKIDFIAFPFFLREYLLNTFPASSRTRDWAREGLVNMCFIGDVSENLFVAVMLKMFPRIPDFVAWGGCVANVVKYFGFYASVFSIMYETFIWFTSKKEKTEKTK